MRLFLLTSAVLVPAMAQATTFDRQILDPAVHPDALCNDGTAAVFYTDEGSGADDDKWIVYLESGGGCSDPASCSDRLTSDPIKMGTGCKDPTDCDASYGAAGAIIPATETYVGLLEDSGTDFAQWNKVFINYCSSDSWTGQGGDMAVAGFPHVDFPGEVHFNGHYILDAVLDELSNRAPGKPEIDDPGATILFAGASAGSAGARHHLDYVADRFPDAADVRGLFDAGFNGRVTVDASGTACSTQLAEGTIPATPSGGDLNRWGYYNPFLDKTCVDSAVLAGVHPAVCFSEEVMVDQNEISTPYFVAQAQFDYLLRDSNGVRNVVTADLGLPDTLANRKQCAIESVQSFGPAVVASGSPMEGWYIPCKPWHVITPRSLAADAVISGKSLVDAMEAWYDPSAPTTDFRLTATCP